MIEKKKMGYVDFAYPQYEARLVTAIVDSDTGKVEIFRSGDNCTEWDTPGDNDRFFPTLEEASKALQQYKNELIARMQEVKTYIQTMNNWHCEISEDDPQFFKEDDYLPESNHYDTPDRAYYRNLYFDSIKEKSYLVDIIRTGFINIKGSSFKVDDIEHIKWGDAMAELTLTGGRKVETGNKMEFDVIKLLFGENVSGHTYRYLNLPLPEWKANDKT